MTQFGRALRELNIVILCTNSSQAKGRVERVNRTLQDRLVKELRLAGISDMAAGNVFQPGFVERFNESLSFPPARRKDLHKKLNGVPARLDEILCHREQRYVTEQLTLSYDSKQIILERNQISEELVGQVRRAVRLLRPANEGALGRYRTSLPRLQQGAACHAHRCG